jgi:CxxC-x17-CxxC domain-containing protein
MPDLSDKTLKCKDCGADFVWTASEQDFYQQKGFDNPPARCPACRQAKKQQRMGDRQMYDVTCAKCGKPAKVPFQPKGDRPVYCSDCFQAMREQK